MDPPQCISVRTITEERERERERVFGGGEEEVSDEVFIILDGF